MWYANRDYVKEVSCTNLNFENVMSAAQIQFLGLFNTATHNTKFSQDSYLLTEFSISYSIDFPRNG